MFKVTLGIISVVIAVFKKLRESLKAETGGSSAGYIIMLVLTLYIMAYTMPDALVALSNATAYEGAGTAVINVATIVLPIMVIFAIVLKILPKEIKAKIGL